jgi:hypothetical protein
MVLMYFLLFYLKIFEWQNIAEGPIIKKLFRYLFKKKGYYFESSDNKVNLHIPKD